MIGEGFPYTNFHDMNLDWMIKIAKDFLDQYTHIQETIATGLEDLDTKTTEGITALQDKADALEALLNEWYNEHSEDIAGQLASALSDLNDWYTTHSEDIASELTTAIASFNAAAETKALNTLESIPDDYTELGHMVDYNLKALKSNGTTVISGLSYFTENKNYKIDGTEQTSSDYITTPLLPVGDFKIIDFCLYKFKANDSNYIPPIVYFDKDMQFIGGFAAYRLTNGIGVVKDHDVIPANAYYFVAMARNDALVETPTVTLYKDSLQIDLTDILHGSTTIYTQSGSETSATNWYTTNFINIDGFKSVTFVGQGYNSGATKIETLTFFDKVGNRVSGVFTNISNNNPRAGKATVKIPDNAFVCKLTTSTAMTDTPLVILNAPDEEPISIMCIGDSITEGYMQSNAIANKPFPVIMQEQLGIDYAVFNAGVGAVNAATYWNTYRSLLDISNFDVFVFMLGLNGGMTDSFDTDVDPYNDYADYASTITGCTCKWIEWIQEQKPDSLIVFATPTLAGSDTTHETQAVNQIENIPELVSRYHIPILDIRNSMGVNEKNISHWLATDKVHAKDGDYYKKLGMLFANIIKPVINIP